jgi:hypothetical protein
MTKCRMCGETANLVAETGQVRTYECAKCGRTWMESGSEPERELPTGDNQ